MRHTTPFRSLAVGLVALSALSACGSKAATTKTATTVSKATTASTAKTTGSAASGSSGSATTTAKAGSSTTAAGGSTTAKKGDAGTLWASCMRDNGINVQDPTVDAKGNTNIQPPKDIDMNSTKTQTAMDACQKYFKDIQGVGNGVSDSEMKDALLAFSACLRKEGLDVGDAKLPTGAPPAGADQQGSTETGGIPLDLVAAVVPRFDKNNPKSGPAVKACASVLSKITGGQAATK
jgi:hypothetical protein